MWNKHVDSSRLIKKAFSLALMFMKQTLCLDKLKPGYIVSIIQIDLKSYAYRTERKIDMGSMILSQNP